MITNINTQKIPSILALYPNTKGVGYSFFYTRARHAHSDMLACRSRDNNKFFARIVNIIKDAEPQVILLEEYRKSKGGIKRGRTLELIKRIERYALRNGIAVKLYSRVDIRSVFSILNISQKHDIARFLAERIPVLFDKVFEKRKGGHPEPYFSALFSAVSLVYTHGESEYFQD